MLKKINNILDKVIHVMSGIVGFLATINLILYAILKVVGRKKRA